MISLMLTQNTTIGVVLPRKSRIGSINKYKNTKENSRPNCDVVYGNSNPTRPNHCYKVN